MIYTVGHSTYRKPERFVEVVKGHVQVILDSRSHPRARFGHFYGSRMAKWLPEHGLEYVYEPRFGGWSKEHLPFKEQYLGKVDIERYAGASFPMDYVHEIRTKSPLGDQERFWEVRGLWDVQWFLTLPSFFLGVKDLLQRHAAGQQVAFMCAESDWFHCHRAMISDYLLFRGIDTTHLHWDPKKIVLHSKAVNPENDETAADRLQKYHPEVIKVWEANK